MSYLLPALAYVVSDNYFLISMSFTTCVGIFIGALLYDGVLKDVEKAIVSIGSFSSLLLMTNFARIFPVLFDSPIHDAKQPFAGLVTIVMVTLFYIFGMWLGVKITNHAHKNKYEHNLGRS